MHTNQQQQYPQHSQPATSTFTYGQRTLVGGNPALPASRASLDLANRYQPSDPPAGSQKSARQGSGSGSGSGIGSWFSRYSLRGGSSRSSVTSTASTGTSASTINTISTASSEYARHSIDNTMAAMHLDSQAFAALIVGVEASEGSRQLSESHASYSVGLRAGQKAYSGYRILVSGRDGQWWAVRHYSDFYDLYTALQRRFPQQASQWASLFPSSNWGMNLSADIVAQWAPQLNVFLRAITGDTDICPCDEVQKFLRESPGSLGCLSPAVDTISSPGHSPTSQTHRMPLHGMWSTNAPRPNAAMERISMPVLKDQARNVSQTATPPTSTPRRVTPISSPNHANLMPAHESAVFAREHQHQHAQNPPAVPPRPGKHQSMGMDYTKRSPFAAVLDEEAVAQIMSRKASDSMLYLSAEKRPNMEPLTMRKKYGLRNNVQYVTGSQANLAEQGPEPRESIGSDYDDDDDGYSHTSVHQTTSGGPGRRDVTPMPSQLPQMAKSMTWGAAKDMSPEPMDVDMGARQSSAVAASTSGRQIQQAQLFHQQQQKSGPVVVKGTVNTLMTTLVAEPLRSAPPSTQQFGSDTFNDADGDAMSPGKRRVGLDDFHLLSIIGKGSYGKVMLARYKDTGKVMAIKVISKSKLRGRPNEIRRVMSERKVLERTVEHPFLVGLQCAFQTKEKLFFCLDYVNGGELFFHLQRERRFSENRARFYAAEITCALEYLHGMGVVYRDLKPENCLLDADGHVKIVDFGLAKEVGPVVWRTEGSALYSVEDGGKTGTFCGTPEYLAPEVLLRQRYGKEVDWYCLGAVLFEMLTGLPPFYDQDNNTMYRRILHEPLRFPATLPPPLRGNGAYNESCGIVPGVGVGKLAQDFITRILDRDPQKRLGHGVFGTENVKRHVFFHGIDWVKIHRQEYAPPFVPKVSSIFDLSNIDPEFRNEPIPESILTEGRVDILAEAAEAERQAELAMQAQLSAFPSPLSTPAAAAGAYFQQQQARMGAGSPMSQNSKQAGLRTSYADANNGDAFQGFSYVSRWVDSPEEQ
ncbi:Serine/threonine-protein kinase Sgk2 [Coemansia erecta]|uniref:Serine/threonine-protein kinase Sgk2 n=1 Tax=Coemansia erecta TaxID=147472 RepID=A0A9W8CQM0_9FUNG|nr:Serine/threonine-protein kinase Sgk2 [Coemansia erecta]